MERESQSQHVGPELSSRRDFLKRGGKVAAVSALVGTAVPRVHAGEDNTIRLALIGCGGRGSGAAANALSVPDSGPVKLFIMADLFENRKEQIRIAVDQVQPRFVRFAAKSGGDANHVAIGHVFVTARCDELIGRAWSAVKQVEGLAFDEFLIEVDQRDVPSDSAALQRERCR